MPEIEINYIAVLLAAVAYMVIGFLWYGPLFGKKWQQLMGFTEDSMKSMKMTMMQSMVGGFIAALLMAYGLAYSAFVWDVFFADTVGKATFAFMMGFWIWLTFVATIQVGAVLWENRPWKIFFLNAGNTFVAFQTMAFIITCLS